MERDTLVYLLFFLSAALFTLGAHRYYAKDRKAAKEINRRLAVLETTADRKEALDLLRRERGLGKPGGSRLTQAVQDGLVQTGLRLETTRFAFAVAGAVVGLTLLTAVLLGFTPYAPVIGAVLSGAVVAAYLAHVRSRRIAQFETQLPDALDIIVRSLRAGHPFQTALSLVARETADPIGSEFGMAFDEVTYGLDTTSAMKNMSRRVGARDLVYVVTSIAVQSQSGGNLSDIMARLSTLIRERFRLRQKIDAMTSEGRVSALMLTMFPVLLFLVISWAMPAYFGDVWDHPTFRTAIYAGGLLLLIGHFIMKRLVNFKY